MQNSPFFPVGMVPVSILEPAADAAGRTGAWISLKGIRRVWLFFYCNQANAATIAVTVNQASAVAGTGSKAITVSVPIWTNLTANTASVFARATDAVSYTTAAGTNKKILIFEIDPATLDTANNFDCITMITGASNVANITSAFAVLEPRMAQATQIDAMID